MSLTNQNQGANKKGGKNAKGGAKAANTLKPQAPKGNQMKPKVNMVRKTGG